MNSLVPFVDLLAQFLLQSFVPRRGPVLFLRLFLQLFAQLSIQHLLAPQLLLAIRQNRGFCLLEVELLQLRLLIMFRRGHSLLGMWALCCLLLGNTGAYDVPLTHEYFEEVVLVGRARVMTQ